MIHSRQIQSRAFIHPVILYLLQFDGINFLPRQRRFQWQDGITKSYIQLNSSIDFWSPSLQSRPRACKYLYFTKCTLIPCMFYVHHLSSNYELIKFIKTYWMQKMRHEIGSKHACNIWCHREPFQKCIKIQIFWEGHKNLTHIFFDIT